MLVQIWLVLQYVLVLCGGAHAVETTLEYANSSTSPLVISTSYTVPTLSKSNNTDGSSSTNASTANNQTTTSQPQLTNFSSIINTTYELSTTNIPNTTTLQTTTTSQKTTIKITTTLTTMKTTMKTTSSKSTGNYSIAITTEDPEISPPGTIDFVLAALTAFLFGILFSIVVFIFVDMFRHNKTTKLHEMRQEIESRKSAQRSFSALAKASERSESAKDSS